MSFDVVVLDDETEDYAGYVPECPAEAEEDGWFQLDQQKLKEAVKNGKLILFTEKEMEALGPHYDADILLFSFKDGSIWAESVESGESLIFLQSLTLT